MLYFNYAAVDPALTNEKCNFWHFRFDADADMKMGALTDAIAKQPQIKNIYLINQDYSFGRAVAAAAKKMLAEKRPDIKIVGDELHPLQKVQDFSPYVAKIKASGADTVITGNWSNDMLLLIKAGKDAGLKVNWYTYYGGALGAPSAIGKDGIGTVKQISEYHNNALPELDPDAAAFKKRFTGKDDEFGYYRLKTAFDMFAAADGQGQVERSGQSRQGARRHEDHDDRRRRRDARRQSPDPDADVRLDVFRQREVRRRKDRPGLQDRRQDQRQGHGAAHRLQDAASFLRSAARAVTPCRPRPAARRRSTR